MTKKNGRGRGGRQHVTDITPIILTEIRDIVRDLATRMDRLEVRMGGLEGRMGGLADRMGGLEGAFGAFKPDVERRLSALEAAVFRNN
ncbi:MAG TPA: hypothetical protein VIG99_13845 [Myxococcaceae bacterium]